MKYYEYLILNDKNTIYKYLVNHTFIIKYCNKQQESNRPGMKEPYMQVGFTYYFLLQRFYDIDPKLYKQGELHPHKLQNVTIFTEFFYLRFFF